MRKNDTLGLVNDLLALRENKWKEDNGLLGRDTVDTLLQDKIDKTMIYWTEMQQDVLKSISE